MFHPLLNIDVYRPPEFARLVGVTKFTVMSWIKANKLTAFKVGGRFFVPATELTRLTKEATQ